jgi:hypothetical protein
VLAVALRWAGLGLRQPVGAISGLLQDYTGWFAGLAAVGIGLYLLRRLLQKHQPHISGQSDARAREKGIRSLPIRPESL